ncbi:alginate export family protein [Sandarakinorhabdus oryzae]|uniref:alginate export family protein n=1 Tax=Sandarakinorhabdus oryzae TaxID=2675220 RepID=UPI0012E21800|nr:alginate export family protein [Sandarakinorhabdus oryzae]
MLRLPFLRRPAGWGVLSGLVLAAPAAAADWFDLSGYQRSRIEAVSGDIRPGGSEQSAFMLRTVVAARLGDGPVRLNAELWDVRAYAIAPGTRLGTGDVNALEPVVANVAADLRGLARRLGPGGRATITAGRMIVNVGSRRVVAAEDYRNTISASTGLRLDLGNRQWGGSLLWIMPQQRLPDGPARVRRNAVVLDRENLDVTLWGADLVRHLHGLDLEASAFHFAEHDQPGLASRDRQLTTASLRLLKPRNAGQWDGEVEAAWQWGAASRSISAAAPRLPVAAWFVHADLGHSWAGPWSPRLSLVADMVSGDRPGDTIRRFDPLFGIRQPDFAPGSLYALIGRTNVMAVGVRGDMANKRSDASISVKPMWAQSRTDQFSQSGARDPAGLSGRFAGWEMSSRVRHWLVKDRLRVEADGVLMLRRGLLRNAPGLPAGDQIAYGSLSLQASF